VPDCPEPRGNGLGEGGSHSDNYRLLNPGSECGYIVIGSPLQPWQTVEVDARSVQDDTLYRALDLLLEHKEALFGICAALVRSVRATYQVLLYDLTSTTLNAMSRGR